MCKLSFYVKSNHVKRGWGRYCSIDCQSKSQRKGKEVICHICGKKTYRRLSKLRHSQSGYYFCSKSCQTKWRNSYFIEEKHPNWINGISSYRNILRRNGIIPVCTCCKLTDERVLIVHHIDHNRQNNQKTNLLWVCLNCHYLIHHDKELDESVRKLTK